MPIKIIDNTEDFNAFINHWNLIDCILNIVPRDEKIHPITQSISLIIARFKDIDYILPISHNEKYSFEIDVNKLCESKAIQYVFDKKYSIEILPKLNWDSIYDINTERFINGDELIVDEDFDTSAHKFFKNQFYNRSNINEKIPILKHYEKFCKMCESINLNIIDEFKFKKWNNDFINSLAKIERNGVSIDETLFISRYGDKCRRLIDNGKVYSQYHFYTSTSRPSNNFGGINFSALNKDDGTRNCFISRYGKDGGLFMVDYSAYHPRLIAQLVEYNLPIDIDAYEYFGKFFFNKDTLSKEEIGESKSIVFRLLYGGIDKEFKKIPYFNKMSDYIDLIWDTANERGYAETPIFKRKVYLKDIEDVNKNKLFNYTCQALETEKNCSIMKSLCSFLDDKDIKLILYMYDSFIFDVSKKDAKYIRDIVDIIKNDNVFPVKCYFGKSLGTVKRVKL